MTAIIDKLASSVWYVAVSVEIAIIASISRGDLCDNLYYRSDLIKSFVVVRFLRASIGARNSG